MIELSPVKYSLVTVSRFLGYELILFLGNPEFSTKFNNRIGWGIPIKF